MKATAEISVNILEIPGSVDVYFDLTFDEGDVPDYVIERIVLRKLETFDVEIELDRKLLDAHTQGWFTKAFEDWFDENIYELTQAEADYRADLAYDRWREEHEFD